MLVLHFGLKSEQSNAINSNLPEVILDSSWISHVKDKDIFDHNDCIKQHQTMHKDQHYDEVIYMAK